MKFNRREKLLINFVHTHNRWIRFCEIVEEMDKYMSERTVTRILNRLTGVILQKKRKGNKTWYR